MSVDCAKYIRSDSGHKRAGEKCRLCTDGVKLRTAAMARSIDQYGPVATSGRAVSGCASGRRAASDGALGGTAAGAAASCVAGFAASCAAGCATG